MEAAESETPRPGTLGPLSVRKPNIPDHQLMKLIGRGSYGEVWLARNIMGSYRAVKIVYRETFDHDRPYEREFEGIKRFEPISRRHPSQVNILHMGREDTCFFYVMELADADENGAADVDVERYRPRTLRSELDRRGALPVAECVEIGLALSTSLAHLHSHGLVHRDIKPSNIVYINGLPKLADIGLVTGFDATRSNVGTIGFAPPEGPGTPEADIYSLGKVLYEASTSRDRQEFPELPTRLSLDVEEHRALLEFNEVLLKACEGQPSRRYPSAHALHEDLLLLRSGESLVRFRQTKKRFATARRLGAVALALAATLAAAFTYQKRQTAKLQKLARDNMALAAEARAKSEEARARLVDIQLGNGLQRMDEGEHGYALLWLTDALKAVDAQPHLAAEHRLRIGLLLDRFPAPVHFGRATGSVFGQFSDDSRKLVLSILGADNTAAVVLDTQTGDVFSRVPLTNALGMQTRKGRVLVSFHGSAAQSWDLQTGRSLGSAMLHPAEIVALAVSDDDHLCATAAADRKVRIWNAKTGEILAQTAEHSNQVRCLTFSRDGTRLASGDGNGSPSFLDDAGSVRVWSTKDGRPLCDWLKEERTLSAVRFSPNGDLVLTTTQLGGRVVVDGVGHSASVWRITSGRRIVSLEHGELVRDADFSPDGRFVATASFDRTAAIWLASTGQRVGEWMKHDEVVEQVRFSPDGLFLATVSRSKVRVWDLRQQHRSPPPLRHNERVNSVSFSPDGRLLFSGGSEGTYRVWNLATEAGASPVLHTGNNLAGASFSPDATKAVACSSRGSLVAIDLRRGEITEFAQRNPGELGVFPVIPSFSPDSCSIVAPWFRNLVRIWNSSTGAEITPPLVHPEMVVDAVFSPDGARIATVSTNKTLSIWDTRSHELVTSIQSAEELWVRPQFSPDGNRILCRAGPLEKLRLWDARSGRQAGPSLAFEGVRHFEYSPDGKWLVLGLHSGGILLCDSQTGIQDGRALPHKFAVSKLKLSMDGFSLLSISADNAARLWDLRSRSLRHTFPHRNRVLDVAFNAIASLVLTTTDDGDAFIWSALTGQRLSPVLSHGRPAHTGAFSPDANHVLTACSECAQIYRLPRQVDPADALVARAEFLAGAHLTRAMQIEPLSGAELEHRWRSLRNAFQGSSSIRSDVQWHVRGLEVGRQSKDLHAMDHNKKYLGTLSPNDPHLARSEAEAKADRLIIPPRDAAAGPTELDLTSFYNASMDRGWHGDPDHDLRSFPTGLVQAAGVRFDARGIVQMSAATNPFLFPSKVLGIPVGRKARKLHVLHGSCTITSGTFKQGAECGRYVLHFKDGRTQLIPIILGRHVNDWWSATDKAELLPESQLAWTGMNANSRIQNRTLQLYSTTCEVHFEDVELAELDILATHLSQSLFVLAITLE